MLASGWKRPAHGSHGSLHGLASHDGAAERVQPSGHSAASVLSHLARLSAALGSRDAMYHLETGVTNEHVPANTDGYLLPLHEVGSAALLPWRLPPSVFRTRTAALQESSCYSDVALPHLTHPPRFPESFVCPAAPDPALHLRPPLHNRRLCGGK